MGFPRLSQQFWCFQQRPGKDAAAKKAAKEAQSKEASAKEAAARAEKAKEAAATWRFWFWAS